MQWLKWTWRNLFRKQAVDSALEDELRSYRQLLEDEKIAAGANPAAARREAAIELGGIEMIKEEVRDIRSGSMLEGFWAELRQSVRGLRRNPGMTVIGTLMLALGMGASITTFSVFEAALLRPLPFRDPGRLVELFETRLDRGMTEVGFSEANFWDFRDHVKSFERVAAYHNNEAALTGDGQPEKVSAPEVTVEFFRTLGVAPVLGRDFAPNEDRAAIAILGNKFWKTRYAGDANILGKALRLNGKSYKVVGVMPAGEPWIDDQIYLPYAYHSGADRGSWEFYAVGRLAPGVTADAARAEMRRVADALAQAYPKDDKGIGFNFQPSSQWIAPESTRGALRLLLAAVVVLLLIACTNVANLLLARGLARHREIAVRTALGAGRGRLVRFVMLESLLLSASGTALGLALAHAALRVVRTVEIRGVPRLDDASLNPWVLTFAVVATLATGVLCGLAPALHMPALGIATVLREGDRQTGASRRQGRLRSILVTAEVALAFLLLVGAGLVVQSLKGLLNVQRGFQTAQRLMFSVSYPESYGQNGVGKQFIDRFFEEISINPDIVASGAVNVRPMQGRSYGMGIDASTHPIAADSPPWAGWRIITPGYFRAVGLPLLRGRIFNATDKPVWAERGQPPPSHRTVILSAALAKTLFPNEDPIGKHTSLWKGQGGLDAEVVGVVGDSLERGLDRGPALTVYLPYGRIGLPSEFVVETRGDPMSVVPAVRAVIAQIDPNLPVADIRTFDDVVSRSVSPRRLNAIVLAAFSGFALLLASLGLYGVLSYSVRRRASEIGLRMALGASDSSILRMTVVQGLRPALLGIAIGAVGAYWLSGYLKSLLFRVQPFDFFTYAGVAALLLVTAILACYLPGRRAMKTDPLIALRLE